jgi:hypothetical protein
MLRSIMLFLLLSLTSIPTLAQKCLPSDPLDVYLKYNSVGACIKWYCRAPPTAANPDGLVFEKNQYCGVWSQMHLVGPRVQTIQKSADPLKSLQELPKRIKMVPLSDPSMAGLPKD